jgi:hypothetical protein
MQLRCCEANKAASNHVGMARMPKHAQATHTLCCWLCLLPAFAAGLTHTLSVCASLKQMQHDACTHPNEATQAHRWCAHERANTHWRCYRLSVCLQHLSICLHSMCARWSLLYKKISAAVLASYNMHVDKLANKTVGIRAAAYQQKTKANSHTPHSHTDQNKQAGDLFWPTLLARRSPAYGQVCHHSYV